MTAKEKLEKLEEIMDLDEGELKETDELASYEEWDSVTVLSLIALLDEEFGKTVKGSEIRELITVRDVMDLMKK